MKLTIVKFENGKFAIRKGNRVFGYHYLTYSRGIGRYEWKWVPYSDIDNTALFEAYDQALLRAKYYTEDVLEPKKVKPDYGKPYDDILKNKYL